MILALIFLFIFVFNLVPAFAPPTWAVLSYIEVVYHLNFFILALIGAIAATLGRLVLAKLSKIIVRDRFLSKQTIKNLDSIKEQLQNRQKLTVGIFLFYAFSPLPSNQLFLAYGLTDLDLSVVALPFFIGRFISYLFWIVTAAGVEQRVAATTLTSGAFFRFYFILMQILTLITVYIFTKIDWRILIVQKKVRWMK